MSALVLLAALLTSQVSPAEPRKPAADDFKPDPTWKPLDDKGKPIWFDPKTRKLIIRARITLTDGYLEHLLCLEQTKEHESVLATEAPAQNIHTGLLLTGAKEGHPVRFVPKFEPPAGTPIRIELEWTDKEGKVQRANAKDFVTDQKSKKPLDIDWVFAGSTWIKNPDTNEAYYAANSGDLFTVSNFTSAILDLPIASSADDSSRSFVANTSRIPPRGTRVTMFLSPVPKDDVLKGAPKR
jgi:hypothetical protein